MSDEPILGLRHMNRLRLLETLYRRPASSRGDLVRHTGLSRATASTLVEELVRAGVVQERDASDDAVPAAHGELRLGPRASGRPPVLLSLVQIGRFQIACTSMSVRREGLACAAEQASRRQVRSLRGLAR